MTQLYHSHDQQLNRQINPGKRQTAADVVAETVPSGTNAV